jgi:hypothetical protein
VIGYAENQGKGAALKTAYSFLYREILKIGGVSLLSFGIDYTLYGLQH